MVEDGQRRIIKAKNRVMKGSGNTRRGRQRVYPPFIVRILGIVQLTFAVGFLVFLWRDLEDVMFSVMASAIALLFGGVGAYGLITGDDWLLVLSLYGG